MIADFIHVGTTASMNRGVFTRLAITAFTVIEISPVIVMSDKDRKLLDQTLLHDYIFKWGKDERNCCMALGLVPMYNHSYKSNCEYLMDFEKNEISIVTMRTVEAGEELFINYNGEWNDETPVWFEVN